MSRPLRLVLGLGAAAILLGAGVWGAALLWIHVGGGEMSGHGWAALIIGVVGTAALSAGLMMLAFHSSRRGYDDRADETPDPDQDRPKAP